MKIDEKTYIRNDIEASKVKILKLHEQIKKRKKEVEEMLKKQKKNMYAYKLY